MCTQNRYPLAKGGVLALSSFLAQGQFYDMRILLFCVASDALKTRVLLRTLIMLLKRVLRIDACVRCASASRACSPPRLLSLEKLLRIERLEALRASHRPARVSRHFACSAILGRPVGTQADLPMISASGTHPIAGEMVTFSRARPVSADGHGRTTWHVSEPGGLPAWHWCKGFRSG